MYLVKSADKKATQELHQKRKMHDATVYSYHASCMWMFTDRESNELLSICGIFCGIYLVFAKKLKQICTVGSDVAASYCTATVRFSQLAKNIISGVVGERRAFALAAPMVV